MKSILFILAVTVGWACAGSPERARAVMRAYDQAYLQWERDVANAPNNDLMNAAWLRIPDQLEAGRQVWGEIKGDLDKAWTLDPASWLLTTTPKFVVKPPAGRIRGRMPKSPAALIREAVRQHHLRSAKVGPYCIAITHVEDKRAMALLELIEKVNENPAVKGAAALGQAILHRRLGDGKLFMAKRQEKLRTAITAPDLTVGKTTTQAITKDEVFRMTKLNLGTVAPDFTGVEVTLDRSRLSDYRGKVVILFFWHALMPAHDDSLALFRKWQEQFAGKDIEILGVNMDNPLRLRKHIAQGTVTWKNFSDSTQAISKLYRIERWPKVYILDREGKIRFSGEPGAFVQITAEELARQ